MNYKILKREISDKLEIFQNTFREKGYKITPQREEIYKTLLESSSHPSVDIIFDHVRLKFPSISIDTVYRNLESLEKLNLVNRILSMDGKSHFEANVFPHHHFICVKCHSISDFTFENANIEKIQLPSEVSKLGKIESTNLIVRGICKKCNNSK